ncbi:hypothetical protein HOLleu_03200 [Holothuria leucospilota]|uniref:Uncharacterized protein n=1 Tax=Holothuria leucospilota TaxID=206669 RepID=A0A9Q1CT62_HOLLE|nr:hypothetical protein HOLleu_03200 [Holothuria leucospilota]
MAGDSNEDLQDLDGFKHPSIALKLGYNLKKLPSIKRILALKESDAVRKKEAKDFIQIVNSNWVNCVSALALSVMRQQKYIKVEDLPKTEDVEEFASFRNREIEKAVKQLEDCFTLPVYRRCQNLVLALLASFNKRRPGGGLSQLRGLGSKLTQAFRSSYGRLGEVRSHLAQSIHIVALTATASVTVRMAIAEKVNLKNPDLVIKSPEKQNVRYSLIKINKQQNLNVVFGPLITELKKEGMDMERVIIFCRSHRHCRELYALFSQQCPEL